jgi:hypothetical protein
LKLANSFVFEQPQALQNVVRFGYFVLEDSLFEVTAALWSRIIPEVAAVTSDPDLSTLKPEQLRPQLAALEPFVYPLRPGPPVIVEGSAVVVDLWAATTQLRSLLQFPAVQGVEANARARHFEDAVQELLDSSPWRPKARFVVSEELAWRAKDRK